MAGTGDATRLYEPLLENQIRTLYVGRLEDGGIECCMVAEDLKAKPYYSALSYTWGDPRQACFHQEGRGTAHHAIHINDQVKLVHENLYRFLLKMCSACPPATLPIWIDALCINQDDNDEKAVQVKRMDEVYKGAETVVVWLGDEDQYTQAGVDALRIVAEINQTLNTDNDVLEEQNRQSRGPGYNVEALVSVFCRSWFRRVWIFQEAAFARNLVVVYGNESISQDTFRNALNYVLRTMVWRRFVRYVYQFTSAKNKAGEKTVPALGAIMLVLTGAFEQSSAMAPTTDPSANVALPEQRTYPKLTSILARGNEATDDRDHVFALMGMLKDSLREGGALDESRLPKVSYDDNWKPRDVFIDWAKFILDKKPTEPEDYMVFTLVEDRAVRNKHDLPSWVPDLSKTLIPGPFRKLRSAETWRPFGTDRNGRLLTVEGSDSIRTKAAKFDTVSSVATSFFELESTKDWASILSFIEPLANAPSPYSAPLDALARTLTADITPRPADAAPLSETIVKWTLREVEEAHQPSLSSVASSLVGSLYSRISGSRNPSDLDAFKPALKPLLRMRQNEEVKAALGVVLHQGIVVDSSLQQFDYRCRESRLGRRLFRTHMNYLGLASGSTAEGDGVWIMPNSPSAFVLRHDKDGSHSLIGEAYVHGVMQGEVAERLNWKTIEIS